MGILRVIKGAFLSKEKKNFNPAIDARKIVWTIVPHFIYNLKENRIITNFNDPLWLDNKHNIMNEVIIYDVKNEDVKGDLIKKINISTFTIVYEFGENEWKLLFLEDFSNHPKHNSEKIKMLFFN